MDNQEKLTQVLIEKGSNLLKAKREFTNFTKNKEADELMNDIENNPHIFVLACVMDRQIPAERAWIIPYLISKEIGGHDFKKFLSLTSEQIKRLFLKNKFHRFNEEMAKNFYLAIQKIHSDYNDDASNLWKNSPKSATIVGRFLEFNGVGIKIATMTANILARDFKIKMEDHICIDISPDIHIKRVFMRMGYIGKNASVDQLIYKARELNPEYPGIFDFSCWEIGRTLCKPSNPNCKGCYIGNFCKKNI